MSGHCTPRSVRWLKFNLVGGIGIGVQFALLILLKGALYFDYLVATAMAVELTVLHNFVWHERFTWMDRTRRDRLISPSRNWPVRLLRFNLSNGAISIIGNLALMKLLAGLWQMNYMLVNGIAIALCSLANFLVGELWVFQ